MYYQNSLVLLCTILYTDIIILLSIKKKYSIEHIYLFQYNLWHWFGKSIENFSFAFANICIPNIIWHDMSIRSGKIYKNQPFQIFIVVSLIQIIPGLKSLKANLNELFWSAQRVSKTCWYHGNSMDRWLVHIVHGYKKVSKLNV